MSTCYSNGVKVFTTQSATGGGVRQTKSDGSECFAETFTTTTVNRITNFSIVYKDGSGATLATGASDSNGTLILSCDGQSFNPDSCPSNGDSGAGGTGGSPNCTLGTCQ